MLTTYMQAHIAGCRDRSIRPDSRLRPALAARVASSGAAKGGWPGAGGEPLPELGVVGEMLSVLPRRLALGET